MENKEIPYIVHIISMDKFTVNYIQFMKYYFGNYRQTFITIAKSINDDFFDDPDVLVLEHKYLLIYNKPVHNLIVNARKIFVSGVFGSIQNALFFLKKDVLKKTYFHFWGGDFYCFRESKIYDLRALKHAIFDKRNLKYCIKNCAGIINLISTDWDEFHKIFPYNVKHFTAPMPGDPNNIVNYDMYRQKGKSNQETCRILVGNSATQTNHHEEVFELIKKFANENIEVVVPLSYGSDKYKDQVIEVGRNLFGDKFYPVTEFLDQATYLSLLNTCEVGIFNVDRQQAMWNIGALFSLGKKVYLRKDTSFWEYYRDFGIQPSDISEINSLNFNDFKALDKDIAEQNVIGMDNIRSDKRKVELWRKVFEDEL